MEKKIGKFFSSEKTIAKVIVALVMIVALVTVFDLSTVYTTFATQDSGYGYGYGVASEYGYGYGYWTEETPTLAITYASCSSSCTITPNTAVTITATFGSAVSGTPDIYITEDAVATQAYTAMSGSGTTWTFGYTTGSGAATAGVVAVRTHSGDGYTPTPTNSTFTITAGGGGNGGGNGGTTTTTTTTETVTTDTGVELTTETVSEVVPTQAAVINADNEAEGLEHFIALTGDVPATDGEWQSVNFIAYGTTNSTGMSVRDRKGVVGDYFDIYGRVPASTTDWYDIDLILTSHKPTQRQISAEQTALVDFTKVYKRLPDFNNIYDEWALYYIGYNIRNVVRNLDSERAAIGSFKGVYGYVPSTSHHWSIMRAIAYTGASR
ncbi:hypothetical protein HN858_00020 [Candidatus Falkowbacteria bacterium]|jgi:hypothetical protein|nr:hypothetical protein [Candidatus Falkowbacteria bacterium]MBT6573493.1 hypothetical protein [Candidatus Falkowbacteria bacterium]MBT7348043.1 hypothetical protein [Candidatus Falkowbacteria bacterium]MBT7501122.1 hypothetical protein [Candidatus Falkowbacteria bacterium]